MLGNFQVAAMEVLVELRSFIDLVVSGGPSSGDWTLLQKAVERVGVVADATLEVESDSGHLGTVLRYC